MVWLFSSSEIFTCSVQPLSSIICLFLCKSYPFLFLGLSFSWVSRYPLRDIYQSSLVRWLIKKAIDNNMENTKHVGVGGSSSSITLDLFGPKDSSSSSSSIFGSVFGPPSTGRGRDSSHSGIIGSLKKQDLGDQSGNAKHGTPDNIPKSSKVESSGITSKDRSSIYQKETVEPCYFSSSIYYGGQEIYSPNTRTTESPPIFKKDGGDDDPNGSNLNSASRGNWWQESLYY